MSWGSAVSVSKSLQEHWLRHKGLLSSQSPLTDDLREKKEYSALLTWLDSETLKAHLCINTWLRLTSPHLINCTPHHLVRRWLRIMNRAELGRELSLFDNTIIGKRALCLTHTHSTLRLRLKPLNGCIAISAYRLSSSSSEQS